MRLPQRLALLWAMLSITGCRTRERVPEQPLPPNTILLSGVMRELSAEPDFTDKLLAQLEGAQHGKKGPALLTPELVHELRRRVLGKDWQGLDRFPGWTMREINPTVRVATHFVGKDPKLEALSAAHPGSAPESPANQQARAFLDLGPYTLDKAETVALESPSTLPGFDTNALVTPLGMSIVRGDGPNALAPEHAESQRLADVLNRLSVNGLPGAQPFAVSFRGHTAHSPEELMTILTATGHTVAVHDARYFANFGHLHYKGMDVVMPFWVNTGLAVPGTGGLFHRPRPMMVPVSHAEYEWEIRAPRGRPGINADVSHYFGVDGKAEFRTMDTLDQAWVLKRYAHTYTDAQAFEVTRLIGLFTVAYMHQHARRPKLAFGGYYALGVCQDPVSAIERKLTGRSTLFPNTADTKLFDDPRDAEVNALMDAIPKDRAGAQPPPERVFGSLPADPGPNASFATIAIPGLAGDLHATYAAWQAGEITHVHGRVFYIARAAGAAALALLLLGLAFGYTRSRD